MAPLNKAMKALSWGTLLLVFLLYGWFLLTEPYFWHRPVPQMIFWFFFAISAITYLYGPKIYIVDLEGIIVQRTIGRIFIPHDQIVSVAIVNRPISFRVVGNGGFFSYYGTFIDRKGANVKVYATSLERMVEIKTTRTTYYLSPAAPEAFTETVRSYIKPPAEGEGRNGVSA